jgi:DNA adenine methylase
MKYLGGKWRIRNWVAGHIRDHAVGCHTYLEPFLGSAAVLYALDIQVQRKIVSDVQPDLIKMWQAVKDGWEPPYVDRTLYEMMRQSKNVSELRGFSGFCCSFGGKWFGGYARDSVMDQRGYSTEGASYLKKLRPILQDVEIFCCSYEAHSPSQGWIVYCDPPYESTTRYNATRKFDTNRFWRTMDRWVEVGAKVLVSEYNAPPHWQTLDSIEKTVSIKRSRSPRAVAVEKIFCRGFASNELGRQDRKATTVQNPARNPTLPKHPETDARAGTEGNTGQGVVGPESESSVPIDGDEMSSLWD